MFTDGLRNSAEKCLGRRTVDNLIDLRIILKTLRNLS